MRDRGWADVGRWPTGLIIENSCFWANDPNYPNESNHPEGCNPRDTCFAEDTELAADPRGNRVVDPGLGNVSPAETGVGTPDYRISHTIDCSGGTAPNNENWIDGWTEFRPN